MIRYALSAIVGALGAILIVSLVLLALLLATPPIRAIDPISPSPSPSAEQTPRTTLIPPVTTTPRASP